MAEYIDREATYRKISELEELARKRVIDTPATSPAYMRYVAQLNERIKMKHIISDAPSADVAPLRHARWQINCDGYYPYCQECRDEPKNRVISKYCPNCGAKMDLE